MLYQTFLNTFWSCGIVVGLLATLVAIKWSAGYLFARNGSRPVKVEPMGVIGLGAKAAPDTETMETAKVFVGQQVAAAKPEPEAEEPVECGNCGKEIKSPPTKMSNSSLSVYDCEHCGITVGVRV